MEGEYNYCLKFGKYKGKRLGWIAGQPFGVSYLDWLLHEKWLVDPAKTAVLVFMSREHIQRILAIERVQIERAKARAKNAEKAAKAEVEQLFAEWEKEQAEKPEGNTSPSGQPSSH